MYFRWQELYAVRELHVLISGARVLLQPHSSERSEPGVL